MSAAACLPYSQAAGNCFAIHGYVPSTGTGHGDPFTVDLIKTVTLRRAGSRAVLASNDQGHENQQD